MKDNIQILLLLTILAVIISSQIKSRGPKAKTQDRKILLDTCALIDGRIIDISRLGFLPTNIVIPEFILHELQMLADSKDAHKRDRARFGLEIVKQLQASSECSVIINKDPINDEKLVDDKLIKLAKQDDLILYTTDFNLIKLAEIQEIKVLNVNELAQQLRPSALPSEIIQVKIIQKGSNPNQGVGYLDDGTMVIVDGAAKSKGQTISVKVNKTHQSSSGKMIFGSIKRD